jgi:hypothetical protein
MDSFICAAARDGRSRGTNFLCDWILATVREFLNQKTESVFWERLDAASQRTWFRDPSTRPYFPSLRSGSLGLGQEDSIWVESVKTKVSRLFIDLNTKILAFESHKCYYNLFIYSILHRYQPCPRMA